ncbi:aminotransferase class I/II-fold pyridoxal phosphate-dependent enzyme [Paenibacillus sp. sptzw28]|uniref:aminotransferase class I/II-fold pyridoxal phosphate-dependent enzyme n=1 Tax=Paenibacillus sp. sptzw28 TaxID=715179 RepID=UPI001C6F5692|nr:aminotransferase class I/II-fold pyridoxal phosphate-dependent enzyme [Paenibacillus sp. sptzw28]QYR21695.1 aminotransferase class I/II-fold pyridoxal phosphate-dependent enzyme [Paenibacillus sp. sptzw28]
MTSVNEKWNAPLYEALTVLANSRPVSYHVPGHKYGQSVEKLKTVDPHAVEIFQSIMSIDVTELSVTDDLHMPTGVIAEAEELAAQTFGAEKTYFLVGGSTAGNIAMLLATCNPEDIIIVQRNVHKSILNGLSLSGARAVFVASQRSSEIGMNGIPSLPDIEEALGMYPEARAVLISNPSYYGVSIDLRPYAELVHKHGIPLLVDEAHGAHYGLHPELPRSALQAGADVVVQSTHKTLPALTLGAMLHTQGARIDRDALRHSLAIVQSSSPSYPIMASLDIARAMIDKFGYSLFEKGLTAAEHLKKWIMESATFLEISGGLKNTHINGVTDPLRLVIKHRKGILSGFELQRRLEQYGCWTEMADPLHVVILIGLAPTDEDIEKLKLALTAISKEHLTNPLALNSQNLSIGHKYQRISKPVQLPRRNIQKSASEMVRPCNAAGRKSAEAVIPYPPGIPILYPGETVMPDTVSYIEQLAEYGAKCQGVTDPSLKTIAVLRES